MTACNGRPRRVLGRLLGPLSLVACSATGSPYGEEGLAGGGGTGDASGGATGGDAGGQQPGSGGASGDAGTGGSGDTGGSGNTGGAWTTANGWTWRNVNIQGMGYVTGLVAHPNPTLAPNTLYARTDVGGAYRYDSTRDAWEPLLDAAVYGAGWFGVESIAVDPQSATDVYVATQGGVLKSTDRGRTWSAHGLTNIYFGANDSYRGSSGERLGVDPKKSGLLYFASRKDGLWRRDGASAWAQVTGGLPAAQDPGFTFVVFDTNAGTATSSRIYVGVYGSGVWTSADGGSSFQRIGSDQNPLRAAVSTDGTLYVTFGGDEAAYGGPGAVRRYEGGTWTAITPSGTNKSYTGVSTHPSDPSIVALTTNQAHISYSTNKGASFTTLPPTYEAQPAYYWMDEWFRWGSAALVLDPNDPTGKKAWRTDGFGISKSLDITSGRFSTVMQGVEELCAQVVKAPPVPGGAALISGVMDAQGFVHKSLDEVPERIFDPTQEYVAQVTSLDFCQSQPEHVAYVGLHEVFETRRLTGYSSNNGTSFARFTSTSPGRAGIIAMSATDPKNMVWSPANEGKSVPVMFTTDGGATWTLSAGLPSDTFQRAHAWWNGQTLTSDRVNGAKFYFLYQAPGGDMAFYRSTDRGASFQKTSANLNVPGTIKWGPGHMVRANPFVEGDLWVTFAPNADSGPVGKLFRSTNGGDSFEIVQAFTSARYSAIGKGASGAYDIYVYGKLGSATREGLYRSEDGGTTFELISDPDRLSLSNMTFLEADQLVAKKVYAATGCRGIFYAVHE